LSARRGAFLLPATLAVVLGIAGAAEINGPAAQGASVTADSSLKADLAAYDQAFAVWTAAYGAAEDQAAKRALKKAHPTQEYAARMIAHSTAGHVQASEWCLERIRDLGLKRKDREALRVQLYDALLGSGESAAALRGVEAMMKDSLLIREIELSGLEQRVRQFIALESNAEHQGHALFLLGKRLARDKVAATAERGLQLIESLLESAPQGTSENDPELARPTLNRQDRKEAEDYVYEKRNLSVGCIAPDFIGSTVDGDPIALADTRGKVTVLSFFGFW
jgi:hypothetical protein